MSWVNLFAGAYSSFVERKRELQNENSYETTVLTRAVRNLTVSTS